MRARELHPVVPRLSSVGNGKIGEVDIPHLLALLHGGGRSLRTVRLTGRTRTDREVTGRAMERWQAQRAEGAMHARFAGDPGERPRFVESVTRLWIDRPDKVREEVDGEGSRYGVKVGETWWMFNEHQGAITNNGSPNHHAGLGEEFGLMLEPALLLPEFDFEIVDEEFQAGRRAVRVHGGKRARSDSHRFFLPPLLPPTDACEFLIDTEHGVLLKLAALFEGEPMVELTIDEIVIDEQLPPETFVFRPPSGEEIEDATERRSLRDEPIDAVAAKASFTVFVATGLDQSWRMRAMHHRERRGQPFEQVHLAYHRDDAAHTFGINEQPASEPVPFVTRREPELVERGGIELSVVRPTERHPLGSVRLHRDGTAIELFSDNLALDRLIEIAIGLRPAG